ncbi:calpain-10-like [Scleropages formosus]|uniref:Calpain-10-like n=1 Tax=Scleropages formosus TaxID=113540 RepID=A0A0P7V8H4_SCLFO|nr:calpain-10-like [Scleropages formosus]
MAGTPGLQGLPMERPRELFADPEFPADDSSLFSDGTSPLVRFRGAVMWMRPQEICQSPVLIPDDPEESHAKQGLLGDCWFLCACAILLKNKHLMDKVFPLGQPLWGEHGYEGSFHFRFWQFGKWVDVQVDDRLPCIGTQLCFSRCYSPSAFWVALLEKAYAKLNGSYEHLWAGQVAEALVDLTGGLAERWSLRKSGNEEERHGEVEKGRRRFNIKHLQAVKGLCAVSGSVHSTPGGASELGQYHAMSLTEWVDVRPKEEEEVCLLRVRNPWGRRSWRGSWRENGERWKQLDPACALDLLGRTQEGEFWMEETEFLEEFDEVTVGYPISSQGYVQSICTGRELPHSHQVGGCWIKGHSSGGCRNSSSFTSNPKFWLQMSEPGEVLVSLLQHRSWRNTAHSQGPGSSYRPLGNSTEHDFQYQAIGLHIWKVKKESSDLARTLNRPPTVSTHCHAYEREVVVQAQLSAGFYLVIPSTYFQGVEASFLLRVFSSAPLTLSAMRTPPPPALASQDGEWETHCSQGSWVLGASAGGSRNFASHRMNPHVPLTVSLRCSEPNVKISLCQHCPPKAFLPIGFHVYKVPEGLAEPQITQDQEPQASCVPHCYAQEVSLQCYLSPGAYVIVPSTYHPDCKADFTVTVARKVLRKVVKSQETLGHIVQEVSVCTFTFG